MSESPSILIVEGRFYEDIGDDLYKGAVAVLDKAELVHERLAVPGAFEVPQAIRFAIRSMEIGSAMNRYSGFVALGCVIRGETSHYDYVCEESARALMDLTMDYSIALGYGILTCENQEQARYRSDPEQGDKGGVAAKACMRMMEVKKELRLVPR
ncbi:MAG: 6,7-dimethyl-8-ribityllumazine synthase [Rhodospirillaceae bacterium]|jgi:6,7-dimethyl-8-ribityllumazine synthase|nr:6,7-dimethyl-8-ribityllumazine synthase [Rhodospirillaceae bacterium]MBT4219098.1 6,7-dimethyl-8-ribityllumazine synthase [Rhodospirillaceae bacterium]MBT5014382.1 6,7-dimethyl-8-ribityllumazine synthase [Rhodospirillaceae bacterium]MBT5308590.1 6,7-dimethyl-8-ribityllumazine synthase [Rhodospirillaceae bacterium]MBT6407775.1 6,7-dimethyl-8-ribityllumazine synthase [Rhodospirillaceae bacterium]